MTVIESLFRCSRRKNLGLVAGSRTGFRTVDRRFRFDDDTDWPASASRDELSLSFPSVQQFIKPNHVDSQQLQDLHPRQEARRRDQRRGQTLPLSDRPRLPHPLTSLSPASIYRPSGSRSVRSPSSKRGRSSPRRCTCPTTRRSGVSRLSCFREALAGPGLSSTRLLTCGLHPPAWIDPSVVKDRAYGPCPDEGDPMPSSFLGRVVKSRSDKWKEGDWIVSLGSWSEYQVVSGDRSFPAR